MKNGVYTGNYTSKLYDQIGLFISLEGLLTTKKIFINELVECHNLMQINLDDYILL